MTAHSCPSPGCEEQVPYEMFACRPHWYSIPKSLRDDLWRAYKGPGSGSVEHVAAMEACGEFLYNDAERRRKLEEGRT